MRRASTSSPTVGSSRNSKSGSPQMARANSTRCRWPPERSPNLRSPNFSRPAAARTSAGGHRLLVIAGKQIDVLADAQRFRNSAHLQHGARSHPVFRIRGVAAENARSSRIGLQQSQQQLHGGRFARAIRSEQGHDLSRTHLKINAAQRPDVPIVLVDAFEAGDDRAQVREALRRCGCSKVAIIFSPPGALSAVWPGIDFVSSVQ